MSSTNKTANLALPQWAATDPFSREDFNDCLAKIDDEIGHRRLLDVTVTEQTNSVKLDLSGIDLDQFAELRLHFDVSDRYMCLRFNGYSENDYICHLYNENTMRYDLISLPPISARISIGRSKYYTSSDMATDRFELSRDLVPKINYLNLYYNSTSLNFEPGDRITVWGVLR